MVDLNPISDPQMKDYPGSNEMQFMDSGLSHWRLTIRSPLWRPPTDVYETDDAVVVRVEIAGMREEDITIELVGRSLSIHGVRPDISTRRAYHQMEIRFGEFSLEMELPVPVATQQVAAAYENGFLIVTLPKSRPLHIPVEDLDE